MHPVLFSIPTPWGAIPIYSYGVMLGSSLLLAWYFIMYMGKRIEGFNHLAARVQSLEEELDVDNADTTVSVGPPEE